LVFRFKNNLIPGLLVILKMKINPNKMLVSLLRSIEIVVVYLVFEALGLEYWWLWWLSLRILLALVFLIISFFINLE